MTAAAPAVVKAAPTVKVTTLAAQPVGVSVLSPDDAWAVSAGISSVAYDWILHWNGSSWTKMTYPGRTTSAQAEFDAVDAVNASDVWAVGSFSGAGGYQGLTEHWNGTSWAKVASPGPVSDMGVTLLGVDGDSASDVWAGGGYVIHWNGTAWAKESVPGIEAYDVASISPSDAWLVGTNSTSQKTSAEHWNGTTWTSVATPTQGTNAVLSSVSADSPDDAWAVGTDTDTAGDYASMMLHWNGTSWTQVSIPSPGSNTLLTSVYAVSPSLAWAVGYYSAGSSDHEHDLLLQWNGTAWTQVPTPQPGPSNGPGAQLESVSASSATNAWAVGSYSIKSGQTGPYRTLMLHWNGTAWTQS
jgi:hypothetical protein